MSTSALICEFNPFHNGHKFLIEKIKENNDKLICIMSGSFVQRGDVSVLDKYTKTKIALENNADLVVELPTIYVLNNAETFADKGVKTAKALGAENLYFGVYNTDIESLKKIVEKLSEESTKNQIYKNMKEGLSYPSSIESVLNESLGENFSEIIKDPNNILAVEYIKACSKYNILPIAVERLDIQHDSNKTTENIASASYIRDLIRTKQKYNIYTDVKVENPAFLNNIESIILYKLKTLSKSELADLPFVSEGLENRMYEIIKFSNSLEDIINKIKTKRYTEARIRRILICSLLNINQELSNSDASYIRVLGMNSNGKSMLKNASLPLITNVTDSYNKLNEKEKRVFDVDILASKVYALAQTKKELKIDNLMQIIKA